MLILASLVTVFLQFQRTDSSYTCTPNLRESNGFDVNWGIYQPSQDQQNTRFLGHKCSTHSLLMADKSRHAFVYSEN